MRRTEDEEITTNTTGVRRSFSFVFRFRSKSVARCRSHVRTPRGNEHVRRQQQATRRKSRPLHRPRTRPRRAAIRRRTIDPPPGNVDETTRTIIRCVVEVQLLILTQQPIERDTIFVLVDRPHHPPLSQLQRPRRRDSTVFSISPMTMIQRRRTTKQPRRSQRDEQNLCFSSERFAFDFSSNDRSSSPSTSDFANAGVAHVRLNRAIEIVIDSIQSLEGAVNNFDQLVFGLIYGRLSSRSEFESIEVEKKISSLVIRWNCSSLGNVTSLSNFKF